MAPVEDPTDRSTNAPSILAINGVFCGVTLVVVMARLYVRAVMLKTAGIDDWLFCGVSVFACYVGETLNGKGMHIWSILPEELIRMLRWQFFHSIFVTVGISLVKLSVAYFLLRLVTSKAYKTFLYCVIAFLVAFTLSSAATIFFSCVPIRASWDRSGEPDAKCFSPDTFTSIGLFNSTINILTDILFASLPISIVWNLQVNMRTKISLMVIMSLGFFACACAIVKTHMQTHVYQNRDFTRSDTYFIWNSLELYTGILAASLPPLRPLFKSILEIRSRATTRYATAQRRGYYLQEEGSVGMTALPKSGSSRYNVDISTKGQASIGGSTCVGGISPGAEPDRNEGDAHSAGDIWPVQGRRNLEARGITKTVDVSVDR